MAKKKEKPVVDNETGKIKVKAKKEKQPDGNKTKGNVTEVKEKMKLKPKDLSQETITKVDLNKPVEKKQEVTDDKITEEKQLEPKEQETPILEEITKEEIDEQKDIVEATPEEIVKVVSESVESGEKLPDNIQKLMNFMEETGGDLNDYVKLNKNYDNLDDKNLLYNKESEANQKASEEQRSTFTNKTNDLFNDEFKGFEYNVGDKNFRFNVKDVDSIKETQSNSDNFFKKFLDKKNHLVNAKEFHKSLYTAMNPDAVAKHFYEQGQADAMKTSIEKAKNVDMDPRQSHGTIEAGGIKVRVLGEDSSDFKFKIKNK